MNKPWWKSGNWWFWTGVITALGISAGALLQEHPSPVKAFLAGSISFVAGAIYAQSKN